MTDERELSTADGLSVDVVQPLVREVVVIFGIFVLMILGTVLPGAGRELPGTEILVGDLVVGLGTLGIVGSLLYAAPKLRRLIEAGLDGPSDVVADAAAIGQYAVAFLAVLVAYQGFAPLLRPLFEANWVYDFAFLFVALVPLAVIAYRFYDALDPLVAFLSGELLGGRDEPTGRTRDEDHS